MGTSKDYLFRARYTRGSTKTESQEELCSGERGRLQANPDGKLLAWDTGDGLMRSGASCVIS